MNNMDELIDALEEKYNPDATVNALLGKEGFTIKKAQSNKKQTMSNTNIYKNLYIGSLFVPRIDRFGSKSYKEVEYFLFQKVETGFKEISTNRSFKITPLEDDEIYVGNLSKYHYNKELVKKYIEGYRTDNLLEELLDSAIKEYHLNKIIFEPKRRIR